MMWHLEQPRKAGWAGEISLVLQMRKLFSEFVIYHVLNSLKAVRVTLTHIFRFYVQYFFYAPTPILLWFSQAVIPGEKKLKGI